MAKQSHIKWAVMDFNLFESINQNDLRLLTTSFS
jgi:hypothetical protein